MKNKMDLKTIEINELLEKEKCVIIDVRSPSEFKDDAIPDSINLPLLSDEERKEIGIIYKKDGAEKAKMRGFKLKISSMNDYVNQFRELSSQGYEIVVYCWRGGYRSTYAQEMLIHAGLHVLKLKGGYKSYRRYLNEQLPLAIQSKKFIVLHGRTGVGKTQILNELLERNIPVLDLEKCASNAGSVFGNIFYADQQPTQKQFESRLYKSLISNNQDYVVVESESKRIGSVYIPEEIFSNMVGGDHYLITAPLDVRVEQTKSDYLKTDSDIDDVIEALDLLTKRLGASRIEEMKNLIKSDQINSVIKDLMVLYYDPMYEKSIEKYEPYKKVIHYNQIEDAILEIERIARKQNEEF